MGETATDVEVGAVRRERNGVDDARTAADHGGERWVDMARGHVDCREAVSDLAANLIEIACDVVEAVGLEGFIHRCAIDAVHAIGRRLGGVDIRGAKHRSGWIVRGDTCIVEPQQRRKADHDGGYCHDRERQTPRSGEGPRWPDHGRTRVRPMTSARALYSQTTHSDLVCRNSP